MYCRKCGFANKTEALYCEKCGEKLAPISVQPVTFQGAAEPQVFKPIFNPTDNPDVHAGSTAPVKKKSHKKLWIILASIFLILILAGGTCFALRMQIVRTVAPKQYLQASLTRTLMAAQGETPESLDLSKFTGKAVSHDFSIDTDEVSLDGSVKYDAKNEKALIDVSLDSNGTTYKDNQIFISPDLIAASLPDLIKDTDSLTVNPKTLADDWAKKGWDDQGMSLSNFENYVHMFFGKNVKAQGKTDTNIDTKAMEESAALWKSLSDSAKFTSEGSVEEKIRGEEVRLDMMSYTVSENKTNDFLQGCLSLLKDQILKQDSQLAGEIPAADYKDQINTMFDELGNLEISGDVVVHFYIDSSGYVRKISTEDVTLTNAGSDADMNFSVEFGNGARPTDDMSAVLSVESDGSTAVATLDCKSSFVDGVYSNKTKLTFSGAADQESSLALSIKWDKTDASGKNFSIQLKGETNGDSVLDLSVKGTLTDDKKSTSLKNATIEVGSGSGDITTVDFSYSVTIIDPSEIVMDTADSTPLFEYKPFTDYMDSITS